MINSHYIPVLPQIQTNTVRCISVCGHLCLPNYLIIGEKKHLLAIIFRLYILTNRWQYRGQDYCCIG